MFHARCVLAALAILLTAVSPALAQPVSSIATALTRLVTGPESYRVTAVGLTAGARPMAAIEPGVPGLPTQPRVVLVGGLDGAVEGAHAVVRLVEWRLGTPIVRNRRRWQVAAVPCVLPDRCDAGPAGSASGAAAALAPPFPPADGFYDAPLLRETRHLWRWITMSGADLVIEVRSGATLEWRANALARGRVAGSSAAGATSLAGALGEGTPGGLGPVAALQVSGPMAAVVDAVRTLLDGTPVPSPSPLNRALVARKVRTPLDLARMLAARYPATPSMSYIPALAWSGAMRVSALTGDPQYRDRAVAQMAPFLRGERPAIVEPGLLTSLAAHQAFFDLDEAGADVMARRAADHILDTGGHDAVRFATGWTDDMFMASSVLARAARRSNDSRYAEAVARLLTTYTARLQRDGVFLHAESGPHAWGRGNGFAAFGLMEALTHLPETWSARPQVLASYRRLMDAMRRHQAPDGAWHQVVDAPGTYREFTVTAMMVAAMARGLRLGWLDASFDGVVERGWRAVQARVTETGDLVDVCTGTGAGPTATREYYLFRPALTGADDRGGAMALTAALEMQALRAPK